MTKKTHTTPIPQPDGSHLSNDHPMKHLKPNPNGGPVLCYAQPGGGLLSKPHPSRKPYMPVRKKAKLITPEEAKIIHERLRGDKKSNQ